MNQADAYALNQIEVEFRTWVDANLRLNKADPFASSQLEITKCGAHLVFDDSEKDSKIKGSPDAKLPHSKWIGR